MPTVRRHYFGWGLLALLLLVGGRVAHGGTLQPYSEAAFQKATAQDHSILLDFHAAWCGMCRRQAEVLNQLLQKESFSALTALQVDFDTATALKQQYGISRQSTLVLLQHGREVRRSIGMVDAAGLEQFLRQGSTP